jgi:Fe-S cluster assembly protein SufD
MNLATPKDLVLSKVGEGKFNSALWPSSTQEDWKYNKIEQFYSQKFAIDHNIDFEDLALIAQSAQSNLCGSQSCVHLFFVNGRLNEELNLPALQRLAQLGVQIDEYSSDSLKDSKSSPSGMQFVNELMNPSALKINFSKKADDQLILQMLFLTDSKHATAIFPNLEIICEAGARAQVIESHCAVNSSANAGEWRNTKVLVHVKERAKLTYIIDQDLDHNSFQFHGLSADIADNGALDVFTLSRGAHMARFDLVANVGQNASANFFGLNFLNGSQKAYHQTKVVHLKPEGISEQLYKSVLDAKSQLAFAGKIRIEQDAQRVLSKQYIKSMLLSSEAEVDAKPALEIFADDVKANHGATVGQLDESQVFYLQSRGINKAAAQALVAKGFYFDVIEKLSSSDLKGFVRKTVESQLNKRTQNE